MKVTFLGTRGYIKPKSSRHRMHTSTMVAYRGRKVMIDCGESWIGRIADLKPDAIVITHPHPDHAFGLKLGSPCPVYATAEAWKKMKKFPIQKEFRRVLQPRRPERIEGITFEAFPVVHSVRAPAVGYRISAGKVVLFYVPDVVRISQPGSGLFRDPNLHRRWCNHYAPADSSREAERPADRPRLHRDTARMV